MEETRYAGKSKAKATRSLHGPDLKTGMQTGLGWMRSSHWPIVERERGSDVSFSGLVPMQECIISGCAHN